MESGNLKPLDDNGMDLFTGDSTGHKILLNNSVTLQRFVQLRIYQVEYKLVFVPCYAKNRSR